MKRALLCLLGVAALACNSEPEVSATSFGGPSTTNDTSGTGDETATTGDASTGTTGEPTTGDSTTGDPASSTTGDGIDCGDGVREGDEECDDGNDSELDECLTTCLLPTCDDGIQSGTESDVDCGGDCTACALCSVCQVDDDCDSGLCNADNFCGFQVRVELDGVDHCSSGGDPTAENLVIPNVPAGTYLATAVMSAWTGFPGPWDPPSTGWTYYALCEGFELTQLRTPDGVRYGDAATAFASIQSSTEMFDFAGGDLSCGRTDTVCGDNSGSVIFDVSLVCDGV